MYQTKELEAGLMLVSLVNKTIHTVGCQHSVDKEQTTQA